MGLPPAKAACRGLSRPFVGKNSDEGRLGKQGPGRKRTNHHLFYIHLILSYYEEKLTVIADAVHRYDCGGCLQCYYEYKISFNLL